MKQRRKHNMKEAVGKRERKIDEEKAAEKRQNRRKGSMKQRRKHSMKEAVEEKKRKTDEESAEIRGGKAEGKTV